MADMSFAFFYNTSVQRPDRKTANPSSHASIPTESSAQPVRPIFKKSSSAGAGAIAANTVAADALTLTKTSSGSSSRGSRRRYSSSSNQITATTTSSSTSPHPDRMTNSTSTPLIPYKRVNKSSRSGNTDGTGPTSLSKTNSGSSGQSPASARKNASANPINVALRDGLSRSQSNNGPVDRSGSVSSVSNTISTMAHSGHSGTNSSESMTTNPFTKRHGRRYLRDGTASYPLPCDLPELHRQTLRTMLLVQVFGSPVCSPNFQTTPPKRVLEVGCGTGYWSSLCHQHFARKGHSVHFTGVDIVSLAPDLGKTTNMKWRFVQHDLAKGTIPFEDEEFDLVFCKDMSFVVPENESRQNLIEEYLRVLKPGGSLEVWEGDHTLRTLRAPSKASADANESDSEDEDEERANMTGTYIMSQHTPFAAAQNQYLIDFNVWIVKALQERKLTCMPCTVVRPLLLQESDSLTDIDCRRLAIPLGEVRWEREGVGVSKTASSRSSGSSNKGKSTVPSTTQSSVLSSAQIALRRTALLTVIQEIESLEPILRESSGKNQEEWDRWMGSMTNDLLKGGGTSSGECLEVGAWWARKKKPKVPRLRKSPLSVPQVERTGSSDSKNPESPGRKKQELLSFSM